jgi:L-2-hydroxyglutarate oxidase LhgO
LIYPVPPKDIPGLGIHITIELNGELKLGPDVEYLNKREQDYSISLVLHDKFFKAVSRYIEGLEHRDIFPDQSGIRPKLQGKGEKFRDFVIKEESGNGYSGWINLIGIESPGLTCSLEIAKKVVNLV